MRSAYFPKSDDALKHLADQERAACSHYEAAVSKALVFAEAGRTVPAEVLDEIARLEARVGSLVTLQLAIEARQPDASKGEGAL